MSFRLAVLLVIALVLLPSCQLLPIDPAEEKESITGISLAEIRAQEESFLSQLDSLVKLQEMRSYERVVTRILGSEPLRLGPLGTAITDRYKASLTGQLALAKFYSFLGQDGEISHQSWVDQIKRHMAFDREGTRESPYRAMNIQDAMSYLITEDLVPIGYVYGRSQDHPLLVEIITQDQQGLQQRTIFEILSSRLLAMGFCAEQGSGCFANMLSHLAGDMDSGAATSLALIQAERINRRQAREADEDQQQKEALDRALNTLRSHLNPSNVLTNHTFATLLTWRAERTDNETYRARLLNEARAKYRVAISGGSVDSMLALGNLYLGGSYGEAEREKSIELLDQAVGLGNADAATTLGWVLANGVGNIEKDPVRGLSYLKKGKEIGTESHGLDYIRYLISPDSAQAVSKQDFEWLRNLAREDDPNAMLILAHIYAKGFYQKPNYSQASRWFKKIPGINPYDAEVVNQVAWILATTEVERLRDAEEAIEIMNTMMLGNQSARQEPMYLDTWAAAYAAIGRWREAISLQIEAVTRAEHNSRYTESPELQEMREHLEAFRQNKALFEEVP